MGIVRPVDVNHHCLRSPGNHPIVTALRQSLGGIMSFSQLPPSERIEKFRQLAFEAKREASLAKGAERDAFMDIAGAWQRLAQLAEVQIEIDKTG